MSKRAGNGCMCAYVFTCRMIFFSSFHLSWLEHFLSKDCCQRPWSSLGWLRLFNVHTDSLLNLVYKIFLKIGAYCHDAALSSGHCIRKLCLMIVHECVIDDDKEAFTKSDGFRYSSCACMGNDDVCCGDMKGEVGGKGEGGDVRVGSGEWGM